jgi:hypothetical protein
MTTIVALLLAGGCASKSDGPAPGGSSEPTQAGCTEIGCQDGLLVRVTPTSAWPSGEYTFTIEADSGTTVCTGSLPLPACETRAISCDGNDVQVTESGCALEPSQHAFGDLMFTSAPASLTVTVTRDGQQVGSRSWTPEYQTVQPNGPGCEPTCTNATVELALTF